MGTRGSILPAAKVNVEICCEFSLKFLNNLRNFVSLPAYVPRRR